MILKIAQKLATAVFTLKWWVSKYPYKIQFTQTKLTLVVRILPAIKTTLKSFLTIFTGPDVFFYLRTLKSTILLLQSFLFSPITSRRSTHIQRFKSSFRLDAEYSRFSSGLRQHRNGIFSIFSNTQLFTACRSVKRNCLVWIGFQERCNYSFLNGPIPTSFCFISFFSATIFQKNCRLGWDSNSDRWSRRRARWPLALGAIIVACATFQQQKFVK